MAVIVWEMRTKNPLLDLSLFRNPTFTSAMLVMFVVGALLYGSTTQLPQFLQTILGYRAVDSGFRQSRRAALADFANARQLGWPVKGYSARWLITFGLIISSLACFTTHTLSTTIDFRTVATARVYQSLGLGFLFVPISVASLRGLGQV
ncbi:MAG: hypothetical protein WKG07_17570 [Hymenobacter sp.]